MCTRLLTTKLTLSLPSFELQCHGTYLINILDLHYLQTALPSVCGEYAFPPLLFTPCFTYFIHSAILHTQITHVI